MQIIKMDILQLLQLLVSKMVRSMTVPAVNKMFDNRAVWQGYPDTLYRIPEAVEACRAFKTRIPRDQQAPNMVDLRPIKNICAIQGQGS